jgi:hypothetical protein
MFDHFMRRTAVPARLSTLAHRQAIRMRTPCWQERWVHFAKRIKETRMSKGRRGNKEAKKPKQAQSAAKSLSPASVAPTVTATPPDRLKKK